MRYKLDVKETDKEIVVEADRTQRKNIAKPHQKTWRWLDLRPLFPKKRTSKSPEDFRKPPGLLARYPLLREAPAAEPIQRTEWNVRDADRLMILIDVSGIGVSKGTVAARDFALALGKPHR
jgi:hypothetical protein